MQQPKNQVFEYIDLITIENSFTLGLAIQALYICEAQKKSLSGVSIFSGQDHFYLAIPRAVII